MSDDLEGLPACSASGEERLNAEGELAVARLAMDAGDLPHAATHLGNAMVEAPALPEVFEALAGLTARAGGADAAIELFGDEHRYIGTAACRATTSTLHPGSPCFSRRSAGEAMMASPSAAM